MGYLVEFCGLKGGGYLKGCVMKFGSEDTRSVYEEHRRVLYFHERGIQVRPGNARDCLLWSHIRCQAMQIGLRKKDCSLNRQGLALMHY